MKNVFKRCIAIVLVLAMSLSGTVSAFAAPAGFESDSLVPELTMLLNLKPPKIMNWQLI